MIPDPRGVWLTPRRQVRSFCQSNKAVRVHFSYAASAPVPGNTQETVDSQLIEGDWGTPSRVRVAPLTFRGLRLASS